MNWKRKIGWTAIFLAVSLATPIGIGHGVAEGLSMGAEDAGTIEYALTDSLKVTIQSVLNEQTDEGTHIGVAVHIRNDGDQVARIPDDEVRLTTDDGVDYTLKPSADNPASLQPKEAVTLRYMLTLMRDDPFHVTALSWVQVDRTVYPKLETAVLTVPVQSLEWQGENGDSVSGLPTQIWGKPFVVPTLSSSIRYLLGGLVLQTDADGPVAIVKLQTENVSKRVQTIPDIRLDGMAGSRVYTGTRVEQGPLQLAPGEKRYVHYAIPLEAHVELQSLDLLTPESFAVDDKHTVAYSIGRLRLPVPPAGPVFDSLNLQPFDWGKPIALDPLNKMIRADVSLSLDSLHRYSGDGFQAFVAWIRMNNQGSGPTPVPGMQLDLVNAAGVHYRGTRATGGDTTLVAGLPGLVRYTFLVPAAEKGDRLAMELQEGDAGGTWRFPIAAFRVTPQSESTIGPLSFYPEEINVNRWSVQASSAASSYTYTVTLNLSINRRADAALLDPQPSMELELVDGQGITVGRQMVALTGGLSNGDTTITIPGNASSGPLSLNVYETVDTPYGKARRLVRTFPAN